MTLLGLLATLAACGGGGSSDSCGSQSIGEAFACALAESFNNAFNNGSSNSNSDSSGAGNSAGPAGVAGGSIEFFYFAEFEPNNSLDNANIFTLPAGPNYMSAGLELRGSVQSADDPADYFIFTPNRSGIFSIYLCGETCAEVLQADAAYIMIYDQNQTTIASTSVGSIVAQELSADLSSGLAYYVEVNGYNTGDEIYDYQLVITE
jgi:hypothetical protein